MNSKLNLFAQETFKECFLIGLKLILKFLRKLVPSVCLLVGDRLDNIV